MTNSEITAIINENQRRVEAFNPPYNPVSGLGSTVPRTLIRYFVKGAPWDTYFPMEMVKANKPLFDKLEKEGSVENALKSSGMSASPNMVSRFLNDLTVLRFKYDFEFWAYLTVKIQDKGSKKMIPFLLNYPQREALRELEEMRLAGMPIRAIVLKARQWGGSTLIQIYMAWIQKELRTNWHSVIIADVEDQARNIRGMYTRLAQHYPASYGKIEFVPFEGSSKNRLIVGRNCIVGVGSAQKPENLRSFDFAMAHLSEVGSFKSTPQRSAEDLAQSIRASIPDVPLSLEVLESTAKGVGNFFHREWLSAKRGISCYRPIFIPWFMIERYRRRVGNPYTFIPFHFKDTYVRYLWSLGATLEGISWYISFKRGKNYSDWRMFNEYPSTDTEAFSSSDMRAFAPEYVQKARINNVEPDYIGELSAASIKGKDALKNIRFVANSQGLLKIWGLPDKDVVVSNRYVVSVDIGGRSPGADYSVIRVFDRYWMIYGEGPEIVATWRGHLDQDLVAWKAAQLAAFYNNALLIVESNSLDKDKESEGTHFLTILDEIVPFYSNIFCRTDPEKIRQGIPAKYGFHTNASTKPMVIDLLNSCLRENLYVERDVIACDEMDTYEIKPDGSYGAVDGCHDDVLMATAIGLWACFRYLPIPKNVEYTSGTTSKKVISEASI